ncbi:MAG TPA: PTS sugar transporter subunit IIA [Gemmatimonadales bacterium]|nr:PTS sugar transporter subunit IIA [Gemmatimonadales bacterium]
MRLADFLEPSTVSFDLAGEDRDSAFGYLVGLLQLNDKSATTVHRQLIRREILGSTGYGFGIAIPHCRTLAVARLRLAFGVHRRGVDMNAVDGGPVRVFFLIVAPPMEVSNQYLPLLGRIAQLVREPEVPARLASLTSYDELQRLLSEKGV